MLFNSFDFALFLPLVFGLYWLIGSERIRAQNALIVAASYYFYGSWDWRFLGLICFSTLVDFGIGRQLARTAVPRQRKYLLWTSLAVNLGLLGCFKYYNFFLDNFVATFAFFGREFSASSLDIILPVGISFYTFQTLSYTIDVYRKQLQPERNFIAFAAFVSFFPQLVAGPIERATSLLPQFTRRRSFDYPTAVDGLRQILWGLFKKIVIADNCAQFANEIFNNSNDYSGSTLLLGAVFFAFQIYGDFSGYSDIAIGTAKLFGFRLMQNFAYPYFSRDIGEFWRRWHISLSTWFRDYLYIPLGGSRVERSKQVRNVFVIFLVSGFWHGANWTFIAWGALHAMFFLPLILTGNNRNNLGPVAENRWLPGLREAASIGFTFLLVTLAWVFFRAENISHALNYLSGIASHSLFFLPEFPGLKQAVITLTLVVFALLIEWLGRDQPHALTRLQRFCGRSGRWIFYLLLVLFMVLFGGSQQEFIYFQF